VHVDAKTAETFDAIGGIGDAGLAKAIEGVRGKSRYYARFDFRAVENGAGDFSDFAIDANARRRSFDEKQIAAAAADEAG
jgi:hypothetical protein